MPCEPHKHFLTCPGLGLRTCDFCSFQDTGSVLGRGLWLQGGGSAWLHSLIFLQAGFVRSPPGWRLAGHPEKRVSSIPGPGPSPKSGLLPPSPEPAQPAWQPSISQRCLWFRSSGQQPSHQYQERQQEWEWGRWEGRLITSEGIIGLAVTRNCLDASLWT